MSEVFMYTDETGNLDYNIAGGGSKYFGIGTATFNGDHDAALGQGQRLRLAHARAGLAFPRGYHAKNDNYRTRTEVYDVIKAQQPRFDATFLAKEKAYSHVKSKGELYLYRMAWYLHFKEIAKQVTDPGDTLYVVVATLGTAARKRAFESAIKEVCEDHGPQDREVVVCHWESSTSWGLQVADYGLWAVQRNLERGDSAFMEAVEPTLKTCFKPWGRAS
ncbi:DUF3800 domain-containing protein [Planobispora takensis]|uniref:DUF3800 domain-containing protein n=1 Tax=Planobispora takensis TaxID=1367882 RepID=A0A8J3WTE3_9ACTN|nr:DUF3800 domain-containing protein [Planobispora takensis]GII01749.1 hypothetical protein Pta02_37570 [Planobispora takensis]